MSIDWLRDLVIIILGLVATGVLIFLAVLIFSLYRRARLILDSTQGILRSVQSAISYSGDKLVKPTMQLVALIQGVTQGIDAISKLFKKREGGRHG